MFGECNHVSSIYTISTPFIPTPSLFLTFSPLYNYLWALSMKTGKAWEPRLYVAYTSWEPRLYVAYTSLSRCNHSTLGTIEWHKDSIAEIKPRILIYSITGNDGISFTLGLLLLHVPALNCSCYTGFSQLHSPMQTQYSCVYKLHHSFLGAHESGETSCAYPGNGNWKC